MEVNLFILLGVILIALAVQFIVEALKGLVTAVCKFKELEDTRVNGLVAPFLSMLWAVALCIFAGVDLFTAFGYPLSYMHIGEITTGIISSLGAGRVYDLIMSFQDYKDKLAIEKVERGEG